VSLRRLLALLVGALSLSVLVGASGKAGAVTPSCNAAATGKDGYTYAGHQAVGAAHGVRATIAQIREPEVAAGHVAGWVGVGGPGQGPNGTDEWLQVGLATVPDSTSFLYAEITRPGASPSFKLLEQGISVGESRRVAVLEMSGRPGWWRIWVDGDPVTNPVFLRGSSLRWSPIATAESWNGGQAACNQFAFRFERVSVSHGLGGSWQAFQPGYRFLDSGYSVRTLAAGSSAREPLARSLSEDSGPLPYAFLASSSS
jgi:hypothetical protein